MWRSTEEVGRRSARPKLGSSPPQILWRGNLHSFPRAVASSEATIGPPACRADFSTVVNDSPKLLAIVSIQMWIVNRLQHSSTFVMVGMVGVRDVNVSSGDCGVFTWRF